jgi:hypothetical protein
MRHYLMTTDEHFEADLKGDDEASEKSKAKAAQKTAQHAHAMERNEQQAAGAAHEKAPGLPGLAAHRDFSQQAGMAGTGFEAPLENTGNSSGSDQSGAESGALGAREAPLDPELAVVVDAWPALPDAIKAGILALVRATK